MFFPLSREAFCPSCEHSLTCFRCKGSAHGFSGIESEPTSGVESSGPPLQATWELTSKGTGELRLGTPVLPGARTWEKRASDTCSGWQGSCPPNLASSRGHNANGSLSEGRELCAQRSHARGPRGLGSPGLPSTAGTRQLYVKWIPGISQKMYSREIALFGSKFCYSFL